MLRALLSFTLIFTFSVFASASEEGSGGLVSADSLLKQPIETELMTPAQFFPGYQPLVTCFTVNNYGVQFYGTSFNWAAAQNIAFNMCYQNSWFPASCVSWGCRWN